MFTSIGHYELLIATYHASISDRSEWFSERLSKEFLSSRSHDSPATKHREGTPRRRNSLHVLASRRAVPGCKQAALDPFSRRRRASVLFPELVNSDVILTNAREVHGPVVAEHVMRLSFALAKRIPDGVRYQQQHVWAQEIVWCGRPREIAEQPLAWSVWEASAATLPNMRRRLGCESSQSASTKTGKPQILLTNASSRRLTEMLAQADYIVLAIPITPVTRA